MQNLLVNLSCEQTSVAEHPCCYENTWHIDSEVIEQAAVTHPDTDECQYMDHRSGSVVLAFTQH